MNKFTEDQYKIFENVAQAKSILRKNGGSIEDEQFLKLADVTKKNGWLGLLTRFVYKDGIDVDEVISLYDDLKSSKLDLGKLSKMSYDDIIDLLYQESNDNSDIEFVARYQDYLIFHVKNYESGLKICSPSWCLKTKMYWDQYTNMGDQFVVIQEKYVNKSGKTKLLYPDHPAYFGSYRNNKNPSVRYGISYTNRSKGPDKILIFDDNNIYISIDNIDDKLKGVISEIKSYLGHHEILDIVPPIDNTVSGLCDELIQYMSEESYAGSFFNSYDDDLEAELELHYGQIPEIFERIENMYVDNVNNFKTLLGDCCAILDYLLYYLDGKLLNLDIKDRFPLSGILLNEMDYPDHSYKFSYGFNEYKYGRLYIKQSYDTIMDWYLYIMSNMGSVFFSFDSIQNGSIQTLLDLYNKDYFMYIIHIFNEVEKEIGVNQESEFFVDIQLHDLRSEMNLVYNSTERIFARIDLLSNGQLKDISSYIPIFDLNKEDLTEKDYTDSFKTIQTILNEKIKGVEVQPFINVNDLSTSKLRLTIPINS